MRSKLPMIFALLITAVLFTLTPVKAQTPTPTACADQEFLKTVNADLATLGGTPDYTKPDVIAMAYVNVAKLRYKFEDATFPAGCETLQRTLVQLLGLSGDAMMAKMAGLADVANAKVYDDFYNEFFTPRTKAVAGDLGVEFGTPAATPAP
jgi:hypothetical protein